MLYYDMLSSPLAGGDNTPLCSGIPWCNHGVVQVYLGCLHVVCTVHHDVVCAAVVSGVLVYVP